MIYLEHYLEHGLEQWFSPLPNSVGCLSFLLQRHSAIESFGGRLDFSSPGDLFIFKEHWAPSCGGGSAPKGRTPRHKHLSSLCVDHICWCALGQSMSDGQAQHHCGREMCRGVATEGHDSLGAISSMIYCKTGIQSIHPIFTGHPLRARHFARHLRTVVSKADTILALIYTFGREAVSEQWQMCWELLRSSGCYRNLQQGKNHPRDQKRKPWEMMLKLRFKE